MLDAYRMNTLADKASGWASIAAGRELEACDVDLRGVLGGDTIEWVASVGGFSATGADPREALLALLQVSRRGVDLAAYARHRVANAPISWVREVLANLLDGDDSADAVDVDELDDFDAVDMLHDLALDEQDPRATFVHCALIAPEP